MAEKKTPKPVSRIGLAPGSTPPPPLSEPVQVLQDAMKSLHKEQEELLLTLSEKYDVSRSLFEAMIDIAPYWDFDTFEAVDISEKTRVVEEITRKIQKAVQPKVNKSWFFRRKRYTVDVQDIAQLLCALQYLRLYEYNRLHISNCYNEKDNYSVVGRMYHRLKNKWNKKRGM